MDSSPRGVDEEIPKIRSLIGDLTRQLEGLSPEAQDSLSQDLQGLQAALS